ncbi:MAG: radical SAM protein [Candidatus Omnitrophica bacterium]|nr:radical SAM protein [Candidatus Omnitrophota bacterium]
MNKKKYKYIYGPVPSWRLGSSLGIDPVSKGKKICSFDCIYCQIGKIGLLTDERGIFINCKDIIEELDSLPPLKIDYITFSGAGEPSLADNLGEMIRAIKKIRREKIAVITNSSLLHREDVRKDLQLADFVIAKFDAPTQEILTTINQPIETVNFEHIISGIKMFKEMYKGKLALQIMFVEQNKGCAQDIAQIAKEINPDEVQINTPLRPCRVKPLPESEVDKIESYFKGLKTISVYKAERKEISPLSDEETLKRRGKV